MTAVQCCDGLDEPWRAAFDMARQTHVHFGAWDPAWLGIERLPDLKVVLVR